MDIESIAWPYDKLHLYSTILYVQLYVIIVISKVECRRAYGEMDQFFIRPYATKIAPYGANDLSSLGTCSEFHAEVRSYLILSCFPRLISVKISDAWLWMS